ncbi:hypothetical protein H2248_009735 [Termitomyces sp. 'cryptogamus']|nr:hypothetical protein H2248_009735 [Termitomyces sp. 'cryptogamus']
MVAKQKKAFAWEDSKQGSLYPASMQTNNSLHTLSPAQPLHTEIIYDKVKFGVYEPSDSAYHSQWFCVLKKNGHIAESFAGCIFLTSDKLNVLVNMVAKQDKAFA